MNNQLLVRLTIRTGLGKCTHQYDEKQGNNNNNNNQYCFLVFRRIGEFISLDFHNETGLSE